MVAMSSLNNQDILSTSDETGSVAANSGTSGTDQSGGGSWFKTEQYSDTIGALGNAFGSIFGNSNQPAPNQGGPAITFQQPNNTNTIIIAVAVLAVAVIAAVIILKRK